MTGVCVNISDSPNAVAFTENEIGAFLVDTWVQEIEVLERYACSHCEVSTIVTSSDIMVLGAADVRSVCEVNWLGSV